MDDKKLKELVMAAMQNNQQAVSAIQQIMQAAQQGDPQAAELAKKIQAIINTMKQEQTRMAKFGAKLNYIRYLNGKCPQGYETQYFKKGGKVCKSCVKKDMEAATVDQFKSKRVRKAFEGQELSLEDMTPKPEPGNLSISPFDYEVNERLHLIVPPKQPSKTIDPRYIPTPPPIQNSKPILPPPPIRDSRDIPTWITEGLKRWGPEKFKMQSMLGIN